MGEFVGPIVEILKCICPPICKCIEYHRKLEEYKENLENRLVELKSQKGGIELRLEAERGFGKLPKPEVNSWLINVQKIIDDAEKVEQIFMKKCFSRARLAKLVEKKIQKVKEWSDKGTSLSSFNSLVIGAPPPVGITFPTTGLVGETTAKKNEEEILGHLMGNEIQKIGVCGMGGAGKTTIVTHLNNRLAGEKKFDHVIWVTVSQPLDLIKVQSRIANALKESLLEKEDKKIRAGTLLSMLKGKRFVLILDDVWEAIQLEELGIPEPTEESRCKLVITTRSLDVCRSMGCTTVQVKPLSEKEALELFYEKAELDVSKVPTLEETVKLMVKQCAGLPLAIVTVASSLKGEEDISEWRNALGELSNNIRSIKVWDDEVFVRLKFSYDRLKDERIQRCFLYCALYPEDDDIPKDELVDCWIAEGLVDEKVNLQATEDRARIIIKSLVKNCLLLESLDYSGRSCIKLHDVVRDMALKHITSKNPLFMVKAGLMLDEFPSGKEWKENLDKVSFMDNLITEIPSSLSPNCQILSTLFLQDNPLKSIPESFFSHMHGLKILNLSRTLIESLPNSISEMTNLTALFLQYCGRLKHVPCLARLRALEKLELRCTAINEVPAGMEMLANLTNLDLFSCKLLKIPTGILPKLCRLQKLQIYCGLETQRVAVEEATRLLKNLNSLTVQFSKLQDFNCYMKSLNSYGMLSEYCLLLNLKYSNLDSDEDEDENEDEDEDNLDSDEDEDEDKDEDELLHMISTFRLKYDVNKVVILEGCNIYGREEDSIVLPKEVELLLIGGCNIPTDILLNVSETSPAGQYSHVKAVHIERCGKLEKLFSSKLMSKLKNLEQIKVDYCDEMEKLIAVDDDDDDNEERSPKEFLLPKLKRLSLYYLPKLKSIWSCNGLVMVCDSLQVIDVQYCWKLKKILSSSSKLQLGVLKNLEEIDVLGCDEMEEIIAIDDVDCKKELIISLPKLRKLTLFEMRELKSIINVCGSTNGVLMVCDSLQEITIGNCPQLKRFPIYLPVDEKGELSPPPALKKIHVYREWWDALEWDNPNAQTLLLPFCEFI